MRTFVMRQLMMAAALVVLGTAASAIGPAPLPAVNLADVKGQTVSLPALARTGNWLLVYVRPGCVPCDSVLRALDAGEDQDAIKRLIVVTAGVNAGELPKFAAANPALTGATWYADADGLLGAALAIEEAPVIMGVSNDTIQWSLAGILSGRSRTRNVMSNWAGKALPPPPQ